MGGKKTRDDARAAKLNKSAMRAVRDLFCMTTTLLEARARLAHGTG
jgi:hypothetical protein